MKLTHVRESKNPAPRRARIKAHRLLYHSTLGLRVIKKKKKSKNLGVDSGAENARTCLHLVCA